MACDLDLAVRGAEPLLALDPLQKEGYRLLVRAVAGGGDALRLAGVMDACRRTLAVQIDAPRARPPVSTRS